MTDEFKNDMYECSRMRYYFDIYLLSDYDYIVLFKVDRNPAAIQTPQLKNVSTLKHYCSGKLLGDFEPHDDCWERKCLQVRGT